jgi:hypothetical protein
VIAKFVGALFLRHHVTAFFHLHRQSANLSPIRICVRLYETFCKFRAIYTFLFLLRHEVSEIFLKKKRKYPGDEPKTLEQPILKSLKFPRFTSLTVQILFEVKPMAHTSFFFCFVLAT